MNGCFCLCHRKRKETLPALNGRWHGSFISDYNRFGFGGSANCTVWPETTYTGRGISASLNQSLPNLLHMWAIGTHTRFVHKGKFMNLFMLNVSGRWYVSICFPPANACWFIVYWKKASLFFLSASWWWGMGLRWIWCSRTCTDYLISDKRANLEEASLDISLKIKPSPWIRNKGHKLTLVMRVYAPDLCKSTHIRQNMIPI